ncbi:heme lyase CcmF/NrfE family subunit [Reinekea marinisedimentorum]|uniref:Cytochrome c-type biogenesis protein CcmF n=1 Tax=Reinekea marinisedimentorum TaxID=230495 RepID=A0A4R3I860_9GAMM|nr:heme lyase CcmF/NrfE family subunit [Reinekea marinisedimentorum]TCS41422.1 cytochrome c-type biogenesis protein CcmF [Reinekea marinisedimentorum]
MFPEFGQFSLILAWVFSLLLAVMPLAGVVLKKQALQQTATALSWAVFFFLAVAFAILLHAFYHDDFSVAVVAANSNSALPWYYKLSASWGNHEGSMLLWVLLLSTWTVAVALFARTLTVELKGSVLGVLGIIAFCFLSFVLFTSNPFERILPMVPADGSDLNPLLQDIGLILHPPTLYMGYVGFSVAFAFAVGALITGRFDASWVRWSRPWTNTAWAFLTIGIALGSWWAYYELGWGGWWFWDPVENASFMPWLIGTALIHSQAVTEKRNLFKSWSVLLAIFAFSFSLLGTFLVRSGVLTSVHAFAADPERGMFILLILGFTIGGSLLLYAFNAAKIKTSGSFELVSRESFLLMNNILLVVIAFAVLFGTLLPLLADAFSWRKLSVGAPFFNSVFNFLMVFLLSLLGIGQLLRWKKHNKKGWRITLLIMLVSAVVIALILPWTLSGKLYWQVWLGMALVFWVVASLVNMVIERTRNSRSFIAGIRKAGVGFWGMWLAHLGLVVSTTGVVLVSNFDIEKDYRVEEGDSVQLNNYRFDVDRFQIIQGPNYVADRGVVSIYRDDKKVAEVNPEKRYYSVQGNVMTEAGIDGSLLRDLYVSMAEPLDDSRKVWSVRLQVKPFVSWLWWGAALMALGSIVSITDRRYRLKTSSASVEKTL